MFKKVLLQAELTLSQAEILDFLYQNGDVKASEIAKKIKRSRAIVYKEAEELAKLGLVEKKEKPNKVAVFSAGHPSLLKKLIEKKETQLEKDKNLLDSFLPDIVSSYNLNHNRPGIRFFEGVNGLREIYDEILNDGKDFYLVRTAYEPVYNDKIVPIVEDFVSERIKKGIKVSAIIPSDVNDVAKDMKWLMERFNVNKNDYTAPVEIDVFGNKVAILSFGDELIGMIIESKQIAQSMKQFFLLVTVASKNNKKNAA